MFARGSTPNDVANHHDASGNSDASLEGLPLGTFQLHHAVDDPERGINGTFSRVFLGLWVTKISEHTIAHELGDEAVEPGNCASAYILIALDQRAHVFRIDLVSQRCRTDQVGK